MDSNAHTEALGRVSKSERKELSALVDFYENQVLRVQSLPRPEMEPTRRLRMFTLALRQICFDRSRALFTAALDAFSNDNAYAMTTIIRSHIESTALLGRIFYLLRKAEGDPSKHGEIADSLRDHLLGSRVPELNAEGAPETLNILSMLDQADKALKATLFSELDEKPPVLRESYEFLCEFSHPNFYSHKLAVTFDSETGQMHFRDDEGLNEIELKLIGYASISGNIFHYLYDQVLEIMPPETTSS